MSIHNYEIKPQNLKKHVQYKIVIDYTIFVAVYSHIRGHVSFFEPYTTPQLWFVS